jgi:hypothetical protein
MNGKPKGWYFDMSPKAVVVHEGSMSRSPDLVATLRRPERSWAMPN